MRKILSIALVGASFLLAGCGGEKTSRAPAPVERAAEASNSVPREVREHVRPIADWSGVADKISALPGVGATRAEFEQNHTQTDADSVANVTYDDEALIVQFLDERGDETESKTARASSVTVWDAQGRNFELSDIDRLIPSDATDLEYEDVHTDDTKLVKTVHGTSATLAKLFPTSKGVFGGSFVWDKSANKFVSGTMAVIFPSPDE
ncbi:MAG: hypothetical protein IJ774_02090 [Selenomonadaceae bacterium]|nr:hypothetical protein [Selenomonadaceae bacterium]